MRKKNWVLPQTPYILQFEGVNLWYPKLNLFNRTEFIVWNIQGLQHRVAKIYGRINQSLWPELPWVGVYAEYLKHFAWNMKRNNLKCICNTFLNFTVIPVNLFFMLVQNVNTMKVSRENLIFYLIRILLVLLKQYANKLYFFQEIFIKSKIFYEFYLRNRMSDFQWYLKKLCLIKYEIYHHVESF